MQPSIEERLITQCPDCESLSVRPEGDSSRCCGSPLKRVELADIEIKSPELDEILAMVYGMNRTELDVCLCVMDVGETTTKEIAAELDIDRSHVSRHLNHLLDLGVLEKQERLLESGGRVNIYTPASLETVRRNFTVGLLKWFVEATDEIEDMSKEKVEAIEALAEQPSELNIYQDTSESV